VHIQAGQCGNQIGTKVGPGGPRLPAGGQYRTRGSPEVPAGRTPPGVPQSLVGPARDPGSEPRGVGLRVRAGVTAGALAPCTPQRAAVSNAAPGGTGVPGSGLTVPPRALASFGK
jgi:hypothetical protein